VVCVRERDAVEKALRPARLINPISSAVCCSEDYSIPAYSGPIICIGKRNGIEIICRSACLADPGIPSVRSPDDYSVVAGGSPCVGVHEGHAVERVALREWILPDPACLGVDQTFLADFSLTKHAWHQSSGG